MKKIIINLVLFFIMISVSYGEDLEGKWGLSANLMGVFPDDSDLEDEILYGGAIEYNFTSVLAVELETGYVKVDDVYQSVKFGEARYIPLMFNLKARYPEGSLNPFIYGGVGIAFAEYKEEDWLRDLGINLDLGTGLAYQVGGGIDIFIADNVALYGKLAYFWSEVDASAYVSTYTVNADVDLNTFTAGGGIKVIF